MSSAGIDLDVGGHFTTSIGDFYGSLAATYAYRYEQQNTTDSPVVESLAVYNSAGWTPRWKIVPRLSWDSRGFARASLTGRFVSSYQDSIRSEEHTSELQSIMRISYAVFCLKTKHLKS